MPSFYQSSVAAFLATPLSQVLAQLSTAYARRGFTYQHTAQTLTWERDLAHLRGALASCMDKAPHARSWGVVLEFSIPRKEMRIDAVILVRDALVVLEAKNSQASTAEANRQLEEYALLLHYFHKASHEKQIVPVHVSPNAPPAALNSLQQQEFFPQLPTYWIAPILHAGWAELASILLEADRPGCAQIDAALWEAGAYFPVPSILDAAVSLRSGLSIREVAHSEASEHEIGTVLNALRQYRDKARAFGEHAICFLTGVPGSGKTLVGLGLAHSTDSQHDPIHFMSGNGPLVAVLQHLFTQESMRKGAPAAQAKTEAKTLIENVHIFARYYTEDYAGAPSNHALIFDEAQRAWNRQQNLRKFKRDYSEPEMLLRILERHEDWAFAVALVGGGQEINDGEAGLEEWGRALTASAKAWTIYASPEVLHGGASTAGHVLFAQDTAPREVLTNEALHLRTSNRSIRAESLATWVNHVLAGDAEAAAALHITERFPIFLTRDLRATRSALQSQAIGSARYGLAGSSGAARLRAEGLEPNAAFHADYPWEHWYLSGPADVRSSFQCEVFATEFEIQGLELDWVGLCWGGDLIRAEQITWLPRTFRHGHTSRWTAIRNTEKQAYRQNAYRVLLTRARQGMVIFIPRGDINDATRLPEEYDRIAVFLQACGVLPLPASLGSIQA